MKKIVTIGLILMLAAGITALAFAAGTEVTAGNKQVAGKEVITTKATTGASTRSDVMVGPNKKMMRGVSNLLFGWTEIPKSIISTTKESNPIIGLTAGTLKGLQKAFPKTISGVVDIVSFPVPNYETPVINPDPLVSGAPATK